MEQLNLTWDGVRDWTNGRIRHEILHNFGGEICSGRKPLAYPIPRGGIPAALLLGDLVEIVENPDSADLFIDDIVDSGRTRALYVERYPNVSFHAIVDKEIDCVCEWVVFPWERMSGERGPEDNIVRILEYIGEDPKREGLIETPQRVLKAYDELFSGYKCHDIASILKVFEDGACDEMVLLKDIEFTSFCEHHMLPFHGVAHVAYIPNGRVVGISKLARIVDVFARRLQIQERLTQQITRCLDEHLTPLGSACVIEARHECMSCRGVMKQQSTMVTSSITGEFRQPEVRQEFFSLVKG